MPLMWKVLNAIYYPQNKLGKGYLARTGEGVEIIQTRMPGECNKQEKLSNRQK
ncbi:Uncharacterised protein [Klebsiella pneumoniae]|nr:Uncharacterised protein [Klebsiella pneumoniae]SWH87769.1 Uncharacterised protein [Klebsiella pneumoniae]SWI21572.1 Uncharacterised protein [Klebsiella pneumoniae]SWS39014.1 Uncharacterised protein [Klebsiella pneumoniae]SWS41649.1 Uncharacterised protein [Klebsiella pneumoniae]